MTLATRVNEGVAARGLTRSRATAVAAEQVLYCIDIQNCGHIVIGMHGLLSLRSLQRRPAPASDAVQRDTGRTRKMACGWYTIRSAASTDTCVCLHKMSLICSNHLLVFVQSTQIAHRSRATPASKRAPQPVGCSNLVLVQVHAKVLRQRLLLDEKGVRQFLLLLQQPIEQRLQLLGRRIMRQVQLRACAVRVAVAWTVS